MAEDRKWMYDGWNLKEGHSKEWLDKTNQFIAHVFSLPNNGLAIYAARASTIESVSIIIETFDNT